MSTRRRMMMASNKNVNTLLLLHLDDSSVDSINGLAPTTSFSTFTSTAKFGEKSASLYANRPIYDISSLNLDTSIIGKLTIDFWVYIYKSRASGYSWWQAVFSTTDIESENSITLRYYYDRGGYILFTGNIATNDRSITGSDVGDGYVVNTWQHIAITKDGTSYKLYINGSAVQSFISSKVLTLNHLYFSSMGFGGSNGQPPYIYIDEFRISDGVRWTTDFTPPTDPYTN